MTVEERYRCSERERERDQGWLLKRVSISEQASQIKLNSCTYVTPVHQFLPIDASVAASTAIA